VNPSPYLRKIKEGAYDGPLVEYNFVSPQDGTCKNYQFCCEHGVCFADRKLDNDTLWANVYNSSQMASVKTQALLRVNERLKNMDVDLGTAFGERRETIDMTLGAFRTITDGIRAAKRLDWRALSRLFRSGGSRSRKLGKMVPYLKTPFQMWLAYQYGWAPLLGDVYNAVERLSTNDGKYTDRYRYGATGRSRDEWKVSVGQGSEGLVVLASLDFVLNLENRVQALTRLDGYVSSTGWKTASEWGLTNPLSVAWELTPFSFVLDWFVPIGSYLSQFDASLGMDFLGGSTTVVCEMKGMYDVRNGTCQTRYCGYNKCIGSTSVYRNDFRRFEMQRSVLHSWPYASLPDVLGLLDLSGCSGRRVVNAISLAITNLF
jgi:hypothetical protein